MYWCKELKLIYATLLLMLELNVNLGAMESKMSSILSKNIDDLKSLEFCTIKNQQRLGSVYGNYKRHHKKAHRRRRTTTMPTTLLETTVAVEETTSLYGTTTEPVIYETTPTKFSKSLRLLARSLDKDIHKKYNIIDKEIHDLMKERHHTKHKRLNKEEIQELSEVSLSISTKKVKKLYRYSSDSNVNKLNAKSCKSGIFQNCTTVIAQIGTTAILHCQVSDITENTVTWIRKKDYSLLSVGLVSFIADKRFFSAHERHFKDWTLHIRFAKSADAGYYECQVPTHPPTRSFIRLILVAAYAEIVGESEKIIQECSMLRLVCVVRRSTEPPSYVFWYFENRMINYDLNGVSVYNARQTSELAIGKAEPRHAGNYTCVPANAKAASVTVHVVQSEAPAAMQNGNNSSCCGNKVHYVILLLLIGLITVRLVGAKQLIAGHDNVL